MEEIPAGHIDVTNFRYRSTPYPMLECTVPGLSQEAFDRNWKPKAASLMCVDSVTRKYVVFQPLSAAKLDKPSTTANITTNKNTNVGANPPCNTENSTSETADWKSREGAKDNSMEEAQTQENIQTFLGWRRIVTERLAFGSCTEFTLSRDLFDPNVPKARLDFRFTLAYVGACTLAIRTEFFALGEGVPKSRLWTCTYQLVMVDKETRQPTTVPKWFLDEYQGRGCMKQPLVIRPFRTPGSTYCHPVLVQWSNTDEFGHATWSSYVHWAVDALHAALLPQRDGGTPTERQSKRGRAVRGSEALRGITTEIMKRGLSKFQVGYYKECLEGDHVDVHVWQEGEREEVFCSLLREDEEVSQVKLVYFTEDGEEGGF